jgi:hypothetical protein
VQMRGAQRADDLCSLRNGALRHVRLPVKAVVIKSNAIMRGTL